jgi:protein associated with RNAse G/E
VNASSKSITVNSRKYDGAVRRSWQADLVRARPRFIELLGTFENDVEHPDLGLIRSGTVSREYFWTDRWYNVFRFHEPSGEFRNFYFNLAMPPKYGNGVLDYVDLDIDILVWPDRRCDVLDLDEFEYNAEILEYPDELVAKVQLELQLLLSMIRKNELPRLDP